MEKRILTKEEWQEIETMQEQAKAKKESKQRVKTLKKLKLKETVKHNLQVNILCFGWLLLTMYALKHGAAQDRNALLVFNTYILIVFGYHLAKRK